MKITRSQFPDSIPSHKELRRQSLTVPHQRPVGGGIPSSAYFEPRSAATMPLSSSRGASQSSTASNIVDTSQKQKQNFRNPSKRTEERESNNGKCNNNKPSINYSLQCLNKQLKEERESSKRLQRCLKGLEQKIDGMEKEIEGLKGSDNPITAEAIPQGEEEYFRLQLDQVDRLGSIQLANIIKNMLILFGTPLSKVRSFMPALAKILDEEDHYMGFANRVHEVLFKKPIATPQDTEAVKLCLDRMILQISKR